MLKVVAALIWEGDTFLIGQRPQNKAQALLWEFVGGKVDEGESKEQALVRECKEELGVAVRVKDVFMEIVHEYESFSVELTLYNTEIESGTPRKIEHNDLKWVRIDEVDDFSFCPADLPIIKRLKEGSENI